jgi:hypothetical protein
MFLLRLLRPGKATKKFWYLLRSTTASSCNQTKGETPKMAKAVGTDVRKFTAKLSATFCLVEFANPENLIQLKRKE